MATPSMLGSYPVERELGRGGMGVVYLARDPRLGRFVAIKVLPEVLALDAESLVRFDREARLLASLNHPNIAAIHGIEEADQRQLLILEYVQGETLASRLALGPLSIDEALDVCRQIALAIESAHDGGVIHRDLKPGNVKVTPGGQVKVLDFGLAKGTAALSNPDLDLSPTTITLSPTKAGVILGTAGYMSPEQARGKPVDRRADIWSFGCVLFECLTGRRAFDGETASDIIARILEREPDWSALPSNTPTRIRELLRRCLEKDVRKRQRDIGDVRMEIEDVITSRASGRSAAEAMGSAPSLPARRRLAAAAAVLALSAAAGYGGWAAMGGRSRGGNEPSAGPVRLSVAIPPTIHAQYAGLTMDGSSVLMFGHLIRADGSDEPRGRIYSRRLDQYEFTALPGTDGAEIFWLSSDGKWLAVLLASDESAGRRLVKVRLDGTSPPSMIAAWDERWQPSAVWLPDGDMLVLTGGGTAFVRLRAGGGPPGPPVKFDFGSAVGFPTFQGPLPGGGHALLLFSTWNTAGYSEEVWVVDAATGKAQRLLENAGQAMISPTGHLLFSRGETLMGAPFDLERRAITADAIALVGGLRTTTWGHGSFDLASNGTLLYPPGGRLGADRRIVTVDAKGTVTAFTSERRPYEKSLQASPDGRRAAVVLPGGGGTFEIWIAERDRAGLRRVVAVPKADCTSPVWSDDGQRLAFSRIGRDSDDGVYVLRVDGNEAARPILKISSTEEAVFPLAWSPDGLGLLVARWLVTSDILLVPVSAAGEAVRPSAVRATSFDESAARFAPNGRLVTFVANDTGQLEVYVAAYGTDGTIGHPILASSGGGMHPVWSADSQRLFYMGKDRRVRSVTIQTTPSLLASPSTILHDFIGLRLRPAEWDILPDGRLLAIQKGQGEDDPTSYNVVVNWRSELQARMGRAR